jgi:hypothetical protein
VELVDQRRSVGPQRIRVEHGQTPFVRDRRQGRVGPVMHADKRNPVGGDRGRQQVEDFRVAVTRESGNDMA